MQVPKMPSLLNVIFIIMCHFCFKRCYSCSTPVQLAYNEFLPSDGIKNEIPIIFLHGIGGVKEYWNDIPQQVADTTNRKVYTIDSRNHGDSDWSDESSFECEVVDVTNFVDKIRAEKVVLVGHSAGGITAMKIALQMPEKVEKLIVEDMKVSDISGQVSGASQLVSLEQLAIKQVPPVESIQEASDFVQKFINDSLPDNVKASFQLDKNSHGYFLKQNPDGSYGFKSNLDILARSIKSFQSESSYLEGVYNGPACFIYGLKSPYDVKQDEANIKDYFPNAEFGGIEDSFHFVHLDSPIQFTEELLTCLKK